MPEGVDASQRVLMRMWRIKKGWVLLGPKLEILFNEYDQASMCAQQNMPCIAFRGQATC
jgi:hypothetical protein